MSEITHLKKPLDEIGFYDRETVSGRVVSNKCGRDFLYYALNYRFPDEFSVDKNNPLHIDRKRLIGYPVPASLAWSQVQFYSVASFLKTHDLTLKINNRTITSFLSFVSSIFFSRMAYQDGIDSIERSIQQNETVGIDISLGWAGLLDHVMFVYGYDAENLYVLDTHKVAELEYEKLTSDYYLKLPKSVVKKRWTKFGRVWQVA